MILISVTKKNPPSVLLVAQRTSDHCSFVGSISPSWKSSLYIFKTNSVVEHIGMDPLHCLGSNSVGYICLTEVLLSDEEIDLLRVVVGKVKTVRICRNIQ